MVQRAAQLYDRALSTYYLTLLLRIACEALTLHEGPTRETWMAYLTTMRHVWEGVSCAPTHIDRRIKALESAPSPAVPNFGLRVRCFAMAEFRGGPHSLHLIPT